MRRARTCALTVVLALVCACSRTSFTAVEREGLPAVALPIEVFGPEGTTVEVALPWSGSREPRSLSLRLHDVIEPDQASASVAGGPWIPLRNSTLTVAPRELAFGGIGGPLRAVRATLPIAVAPPRGERSLTVRFRVDRRPGLSIGFRVLDVDVLDADGGSLLPPGAVARPHPGSWSPPRTAPADLSRGATLWATAPLVSPTTRSPIVAHCGDCHARDGSDLKFFNASNAAIIEMAMRFGLARDDAERIASYVRTLAGPAAGRPWNPPYQPGPGTQDAPLAEWSAGAGLDWVLDDEREALRHAFPSGVSSDAVATRGALDLSTVPIGIPLPDWNDWLPAVHPSDAWGADFGNDPAATELEGLAAQLRGKPPAEARTIAHAPAFQDALDHWHSAVAALIARHDPESKTDVGTTAALSAARWRAVKTWELLHATELEDAPRQRFGARAQARGWPISAAVFSGATPYRLNVLRESSTALGGNLGYAYHTSAWFQLAAILQPGARASGTLEPFYWRDAYAFLGDLRRATRRAEPARMFLLLVRGTQEVDRSGDPGAYGWNLNEAAPWYVTLPDWARESWNEPGDADQRRELMTAYLRAWLSKNRSYTPAQWPRCTTCDWRYDVPPADYVPRSDWPASSNVADKLLSALSTFRAWGIDCAVLADYADWASTLWPAGDWRATAGVCP